MSENPWVQYFDRRAKQYGDSILTSDYFNERSFYLQRDKILHWLGEIKGKTVLDAGCGVGAFSEPLVKNNMVYGVDFSEKSLEFSRKRGLQVSCGDISNLGFGDKKFDLILCIGVIQLVNDCEHIIRDLSRVVKQNGILLIETLNVCSIQRKALMWVDRSKKFERMYDMRDLRYLYEKHGFQDIEFMYIYYPFNNVSFSKGDGFIRRYCSTSFAIRGVKAMCERPG